MAWMKKSKRRLINNLLGTGIDTISALEYAGSGLVGNYMKLEKMV